MHYDSEYRFHNAPVLANGETILWKAKPQKKGFIATRSLAMMPIAIIWLIFDLQFLAAAGNFMFAGFMLLHLFPVWLWLGNVLTAGRQWKNTAYYATNRRIIIQRGIWAVNETSVFYKDIRNLQTRIGILDKAFGTGDIFIDDGYYHSKRRMPVHMLEDLDDPQKVYSRLQKIVLDIQTDIEFPNAYRPEENPGYNTQYRP